MKKIISLFLVILCLFSLCACAEKTEEKNGGELFTPLFRFTVSEGTGDNTKLFYLPKSDGFLYLHQKPEGGFTVGFVSPSRSISVENLATGSGSVDFATVWEKEKGQAFILSGRELLHLVLEENLFHTTPVPDIIYTVGNLAYDSLSFVSESENLLLLHPIDFSETYVLCNKSALPDYKTLITTSNSGKNIWYAKGNDEGSYSGIAFFEYGSNTPLGSRDFTFDRFQAVGTGKVLFITEEEGKTTYRYINLENGEEKVFTAKETFDAAICDPDGTVLCTAKKVDEGGKITVIDLLTAKEKGSYSIDYGAPAHSLAVDASATTLLVAFGEGSDQILATLDLTKF